MTRVRNRLYYSVKRWLPVSVRLGLRSWYARRTRETASQTWPILPGSEKPPPWWRGWPEGRQFALVLTHDVERAEGLAKCRKLMQLHLELGFRSCFNFVPEGDYRVSREQREDLTLNGFEVGVHDLHHDGRLYKSRRQFAAHAVRINQHLQEWGAVGFRSAYMMHNLDWIHDLNLQYDSSTFDTDPFEPQPDGVRTIFPFWVPRPNGAGGGRQEIGCPEGRPSPYSYVSPNTLSRRGYVELPYTLAQDSTLFLFLRERNTDIWRNKLEWIASRGGMVLVNVHPDYVFFGRGSPGQGEYPAALYREFLEWVKQRYPGQYWQALPKDVARLCAHAASAGTGL